MTDTPSTTPTPPSPDIEAIWARFTEQYPRIHRLASFQHRRLQGHELKEAVANTIAWAWWAYRNKALQGGDPDRLIGTIVRFSAKRVRDEELLGGSPRINDVMSRRGRSRNGHSVTSLPNYDDEDSAPEAHAALRHRGPDPAEEAASRIDYEARLATLTEKERALVEDLVMGYTTTEIAARRGVKHQAVSDMRKTVARKWAEHEGGKNTR